MKNKFTVSIVIPVYNEEKVIGDCLRSLIEQTYKPLEIILVDDGSDDNTLKIVSSIQYPVSSIKVLHQKHQGPGSARNLGASKSKGKILIFVDADMTFDKNFIGDLVRPIIDGKSIGTFSKNEMVANSENVWSICWNINRNVEKDRMLPKNYPNYAPVFRAILKKEFDGVGGFDTTGEYTDDWSLSRKLKVKSTLARSAIYYHSNPQTLREVFKQARWIGKNEFITGTLFRKIRSLIFYSPLLSLLIGVYKSFLNFNFAFLVFKLIYDFAIWISVIKSFFGEAKFK